MAEMSLECYKSTNCHTLVVLIDLPPLNRENDAPHSLPFTDGSDMYIHIVLYNSCNVRYSTKKKNKSCQ